MGANLVAVIDDEPAITALFADLLADEGYGVSVWHSGAGAHAFVLRVEPVTIILDMHMETRDAGIVVAQALHDDPATAAIPVIVCSAGIEHDPGRRERLRLLGCHYHAKPITITKLLALLRVLAPIIQTDQ